MAVRLVARLICYTSPKIAKGENMEVEFTGSELESLAMRIKWEIDAEYAQGMNPFNGVLPDIWNKLTPLLNACNEDTRVLIKILDS
jgi:hypothetical protein